MADGVARSPSRLCSRDGKICCYGDALSTIFLLACFCTLLPTFRFSFFFSFLIFFPLHPGMSIFLVSLRLCSSHLLLSASTYLLVRVLSACLKTSRIRNKNRGDGTAAVPTRKRQDETNDVHIEIEKNGTDVPTSGAFDFSSQWYPEHVARMIL